MVEQPAAGAQLVAQEPEVGRVVLDPDVLDEPDGAHGVEVGLGHVPVVEMAHLGEVVEAVAS